MNKLLQQQDIRHIPYALPDQSPARSAGLFFNKMEYAIRNQISVFLPQR